jgi:hypothetical protein
VCSTSARDQNGRRCWNRQVGSVGVTEPRPGWYPDPASDGGGFRWWDGRDWTAALSSTQQAPPPRSRRLSGGRRSLALVLGLTLLVSGGMVGLLGWQALPGTTGDRAAPGSGGPAPSAAATVDRAGYGAYGRLNEVTGEVAFGSATMTLPGSPYRSVGGAIEVPDAFDAMFLATAPVHPDFDGSQTWTAMVGLGYIPAEAWQDDPRAFAEEAMAGFSLRFFGRNHTSVRDLGYQLTWVDGHSCAEVTGDVHYDVKGLPSSYDRVRLIGCPRSDGSVIAAVSSIPDDADPELSRLAEDALSTLAIG